MARLDRSSLGETAVKLSCASTQPAHAQSYWKSPEAQTLISHKISMSSFPVTQHLIVHTDQCFSVQALSSHHYCSSWVVHFILSGHTSRLKTTPATTFSSTLNVHLLTPSTPITNLLSASPPLPPWYGTVSTRRKRKPPGQKQRTHTPLLYIHHANPQLLPPHTHSSHTAPFLYEPSYWLQRVQLWKALHLHWTRERSISVRTSNEIQVASWERNGGGG